MPEESRAQLGRAAGSVAPVTPHVPISSWGPCSHPHLVPQPAHLSQQYRHRAEHHCESTPSNPQPFLLLGARYPCCLFTIHTALRAPVTDSSDDGTSALAVPGGPIKLSHSISCNTALYEALQPAPPRALGCPHPHHNVCCHLCPQALQHEVHGSACGTANAISPRAIEANPFCCTPLEAAVAVPHRGGGVAQHSMAAPRSTMPICSTRVSTGEHHRAEPRSSSASKTAVCDPHSCHLGAFGE